MGSHWYVLCSKPHKEEALYQHAQAQGFRLFYPCVKVQRANPRARSWVPYFPGYMFVYSDLARVGVSIFRYMPHAAGLVSFGDEPARVETALVEAIRRQLTTINAPGAERLRSLRTGDQVQITGGPFAGCAAIFDARLNGGERVRVLLSLLNERRVALELEAAQIR
jgi:transcriptional antiterminator RfaH